MQRRRPLLAPGVGLGTNGAMTKMRLVAASALACVFLQSCGTAHAVRWAYGKPSVFEEPSAHSEECALRAGIGIPVIVGGAMFDVVTFPAQALFGVWPWWGSSSQHMRPRQS